MSTTMFHGRTTPPSLRDALVRIHDDPDDDDAVQAALEPALAAAKAFAARKVRSLPPEVTADDLFSYLSEQVLTSLRLLDRSMEPHQMLAWIFDRFRYAVADAGRDADPLSRRLRTRVKDAQEKLRARETELRRELTAAERDEIAASALGERQIKGSNASTLIQLVSLGISKVAFDEACVAPVEAGDDTVAQAHLFQAIHIAGADVADDNVFADFATAVATNNVSNRGISAAMRVALADGLRQLGWTAE